METDYWVSGVKPLSPTGQFKKLLTKDKEF